MTQPHKRPSKFELVLDRIGFHDRGKDLTWDQMNWYMTFAKRDLAELTQGDLLNLKEEVAAIAWASYGYRHEANVMPELEQLRELQSSVQQILEQLLSDSEATYGPCTVTFRVTVWEGYDEDKGSRTTVLRPMGGFEMDASPRRIYKDYLMAHMFVLLWKWARHIKRCPRCKQIFLQLRSHAEYCSRACQSVEAMRKKRESQYKTISSRTKQRKESLHG